MSDPQSAGPGGFFPSETLPSPAPSAVSTRSGANLPHPRARALKSGSNKEDTVRRFVEDRLTVVARRYVKKHGIQQPGDDVVGYTAFSELCKDLHGVIDVLWLSGTPGLQIPFLLNVASEFTKYIVSFPPAPRSTFAVLDKLDHCFASLLSGIDAESKEPLPGFENGLRAGMTVTDMVRCRSSVEQTRILIAEYMNTAEVVEDENEDTDMATETETETETDAGRGSKAPAAWTEDDERLNMDVARVYEKTIVQLGERLGDVWGAVGGPLAPGPEPNPTCG
ncbi:meiotic recombination protein DMC1 [Plectosphaerella plurivora]|uniref:Meiotic recombination protein DMC1 n=1 Tax=Plectosphaerella plurivora TaxID=936078 RepID=A0A9P8VFP9_9PEZI|nr:meiotic recombination protein DMC1 [Plectosphaerella plurivora]